MSSRMLSEHFSLEEFVRSDAAARLGIDNTPSESIIRNLGVIAALLEEVRAKLDAPLIISSGYRCAQLNFSIPGSSKSSAHVLGYAADFHVQGMSPFELCSRVSAMALPFDELIYEYQSWCHLSADPLARGKVLTKKYGKSYETGLIP